MTRATLTLLPLGDSLTVGGGSQNAGYRGPLLELLKTDGIGTQFIGDAETFPGTLPLDQRRHAGHASYTTVDIAANLDGLDTTTYEEYGGESRDPHGGHWITGIPDLHPPLDPDVVLLLAGTNDAVRHQVAYDEANSRYTSLLDKLAQLLPLTTILCALLPPASDQRAHLIPPFNAAIIDAVESATSRGVDAHLVDLFTNYAGGWVDGLHLDESGYRWVAHRWRDAIRQEPILYMEPSCPSRDPLRK